MKLDTKQQVRHYLLSTGILPEGMEVEGVQGGVSARVWKVKAGNQRWVLKQALDKLAVAAEWFSDIERIHREHEVMEAMQPLLPNGAAPKVVHTDYTHHVYIMHAAEEGAGTWKEVLMQGHFNPVHAFNAALLLRCFHHGSRRLDEKNKTRFSDQTYFLQLRIDPFHRYLMRQYPDLAAPIQKLIADLTEQKQCLVHGDFSPKNILVESTNNLVLIDYEVAHWGNPVFDLAYCTGHLMLKGWHLQKEKEVGELIAVFLRTYNETTDRLIPHLGLMLLARMDGKSPVPYIQNNDLKNKIRAVAKRWIRDDAVAGDPLQTIQSALLRQDH